MEAAETAYQDVAHICFETQMTLADFSITYLFYAKRPQGLAFQSRNDS